jgi:hypothetical protein
MAFIKLQFKPGVNRDQTNYSNEGGWWECDKIRFRSGYPQKLGGWLKSNTSTFIGVCRQMWLWVTTYGDIFLGLGTNSKLYINAGAIGGSYYDITPLRSSNPTQTVTTNGISTTNLSTTVTVTTSVAHNATTGDYVTLSGVSGSVGGITAATLNANFQLTVTGSTTFTIQSPTAATSTATGGGASITASFEISPGYGISTLGYGWGTGAWGGPASGSIPARAWGTASQSPIRLAQTDWWLDNFYNDLVANIRNGAPYYWIRGTLTDPGVALSTRAVSLQTIASSAGHNPAYVPVKVMQTLVSQQSRHLIAFGAVPFGSTTAADFDPLLIRWSSQDDPGQWDESDPTNSAGSIRISRGSRIVRALPTRQEVLIWTDNHLYTLQFLGNQYVYGVQEYADNISIASPRAVATAANITYWMGRDKFYAYTGRVETVPCTLRNYVFQNIDFTQSDQIVCGTNEEWNEVWWFYPSKNNNPNNWNDSYVVYNHLEQIWYYGSLSRTAWLDDPVLPYPQGTDSVPTNANTVTYTGPGTLYSHENGVDADTAPMTSYIQSNDFDIGDGEQFMLSRRMIPDIDVGGSTDTTPTTTLELRFRDFPGNALQDQPSDTQRVVQTSVNQYTDQVFIRARARQMAMKIMSTDLGVNWQLGAPRLDARQDGKR